MAENVTFTPVNVAKPDWACPHCAKRYGVDHDAAQACADAGPAPDVPPGAIILDLTGGARRRYDGSRRLADPKRLFGAAEVGPITVVRDDARNPVAHRRELTVDGTVINSDKIAQAKVLDGDLVVFADSEDTDTLGYHADTYVGAPEWIASLFGHTRWGSRFKARDAATPVWFFSSYSSNWERTNTWFAPFPDDRHRDVYNMLTAGFLDTVAEADPDELAVLYRKKMENRRHTQSGLNNTLVSMVDDYTLISVARAQGAVDLASALRYINVHFTAVVDWIMAAAVDWAAGGQTAVPPLSIRLSDLPSKPGKRRLALMDGFGEDYFVAWRAVIDALVIPIPDPIPALERSER